MRHIARLSKVVWALNLGLLAIVVSLVVLAVLPARSSGPNPDATSAPKTDQSPAAKDTPRPAADSKLILARDMFGVGQPAAPQPTSKPQSALPAAPRKESRTPQPFLPCVLHCQLPAWQTYGLSPGQAPPH